MVVIDLHEHHQMNWMSRDCNDPSFFLSCTVETADSEHFCQTSLGTIRVRIWSKHGALLSVRILKVWWWPFNHIGLYLGRQLVNSEDKLSASLHIPRVLTIKCCRFPHSQSIEGVGCTPQLIDTSLQLIVISLSFTALIFTASNFLFVMDQTNSQE